MADVSGPPSRRSATEDDPADGRARTDRAQLFVLTALVLAVLFVALALLLNTAIFTENLATRSTDPGVSDAIEFRGSMDESMGDVIVATNIRYDQDVVALSSGLPTVLEEWRGGARRHAISTGHDASVTFVSIDEQGDQVIQDDVRPFTDTVGNRNWTVVSGVTEMRRFNVTLERSPKLAPGDDPATDDTTVFSIRADDGGTTEWQLFAYNDTDSLEDHLDIQVRSAAGDAFCGGYRPHATVDVVAGTVNGSCTFPSITAATDGSFDIVVTRGDDAEGEYRMVMRNPSSIGAGVALEGSGSLPRRADAVWTATFNVSYDGPDVAYGGEVTVTP